MRHALRTIGLVVAGMLVGLFIAQWPRGVNAAAQERKPGVVVTVVGKDPRGNAIYLVARPGTGACWIGVAAETPTLQPAPELGGSCQ